MSQSGLHAILFYRLYLATLLYQSHSCYGNHTLAVCERPLNKNTNILEIIAKSDKYRASSVFQQPVFCKEHETYLGSTNHTLAL